MPLVLLVLTLLASPGPGQGVDARPAALLRAAQLRTVGQHQAVVELLTPWVRAHPEDDEAHYRLGQAHVDLGQPDRGLEIWRRVLARAPQGDQKYRAVSQRCRRAGLLQEAIDVLVDGGQALEDPHRFSWEVAELHLELEDYAAAVAGLLAYARQVPQHYGVVEGRLLATVRAEAGSGSNQGTGTPAARGARTAGLVDALQTAVDEVSPGGDPLPATMLLSALLLETGDPQRGLQALEDIARFPDAGPAVFQYASRCEAMGHNAVAAQAYALYVERDAESPYRYESLLRQASLEERLGHYEGAAFLYRQVIEAFPGRPEAIEALFRTGRLQLEVEGNPAAARQSLEAALSGDRTGALRWSIPRLLAECDLRQDDLAAASRRLHHILTGPDEGVPSARLGLAELAWFQGDFATAATHLDCLLSRHAGHHLANDALTLLLTIDDHARHGESLAALSRAGLHHRQGRKAEAEAEWAWVDAHAPATMRQLSLATRARLAEPAEPERALELYQRLRAEFPDGPLAIQAELGRARLLERGRRADEALKVYEAALLQWTDDPRAPEIRLEIQRLRTLTGTQRAGR